MMRPLLADLWYGAKVLAVMTLAVAGVSQAHEFYDGWCCNDRDCQPIPQQAVEVTPDGYKVTLRPTEHGMLKAETVTHSYLVPYREARVSPDGRFHACIYPDVNTMRCFYAPPVGS